MLHLVPSFHHRLSIHPAICELTRRALWLPSQPSNNHNTSDYNLKASLLFCASCMRCLAPRVRCLSAGGVGSHGGRRDSTASVAEGDPSHADQVHLHCVRIPRWLWKFFCDFGEVDRWLEQLRDESKRLTSIGRQIVGRGIRSTGYPPPSPPPPPTLLFLPISYSHSTCHHSSAPPLKLSVQLFLLTQLS